MLLFYHGIKPAFLLKIKTNSIFKRNKNKKIVLQKILAFEIDSDRNQENITVMNRI